MPLGTPQDVIEATGTTSAASTASFSVTSGHHIFVAVASRKTASLHSALTLSNSQSLTQTSVIDASYDAGTNGRLRLQVWRLISNGASMTVTATPGATATDSFGIHVTSISGASTDIANAASNNNSSGDPAPSLGSAPAASSTVLGWGIWNNASAISPPTNYTELNEFFTFSETNYPLQTVYDAGSAAQSATWSSSGNSIAGLLEVKTSSTAYNIAIDPGSYTQTGTAITLKAQRNFPLTPGSYTQTGTAIALRYGPVLSIAPGSYALTGTAIGFRANLSIDIDPGSYAYTGTNFGLTRRSVLALDPGSYTQTGTAITFRASLSVDIEEGAYTLTGSDFEFTYTDYIHVWTAVSANSLDWSTVVAATDTWTPLDPASDDWTALDPASNDWTEQ
jgi:hypothetical protein